MKVVAAALLAVMTSGMMAGPAVGQTAGPRVVVNGVDVPLVAPAVMLNGQVLAPMPGLFDPMGAVSAFYETTQTIVVTNRLRTTVQMRLNDTTALVNGKTARLPDAPAQIGSHVFIPVQAVFAHAPRRAKTAWTGINTCDPICAGAAGSRAVFPLTSAVVSFNRICTVVRRRLVTTMVWVVS